jgi:hypothetical protein
MDFRTELAKWGYNKGNSIDVEILIDEILPSLFSQQERSYSEEEVLAILVKAIREVKTKRLTFFDGGSEYPIYSNLSKWFEQFKKK